MNFKKSLILLVLQVSFILAKEFSYEGYKIVSLKPTTKEHIDLISNLENHHDFDVLSHNKALNKPAFVLLSPKALAKYQPIFEKNHLETSIVNDNFQRSLDVEKKSMERSSKRNSKNIVGTFAKYPDIMSFIDSVVETLNSPQIAVSTYTAGTTFENRIIKTLVFKTPSAKRGIFIDCGIHAREWIAVSSCIFFIDQLAQGWKNNDPDTLRILNQYEIHIIPLLNPDGYSWSHSNFRMWRKNRNPNSDFACIGTDLNRNFGFMWMTGGSSSFECSDVYAGKGPNSELETQALIRAINNKRDYWDAYLTIHTYGNYWLSSWSYTDTEFPDDLDDLIAKSRIGADAMQEVAGSKIKTGNSGILFGRLSGVSDDWAKGDAKIKYSYTLELAPGKEDDNYSQTFSLTEDNAPRVGRELTAGIKKFLNAIF